MKFSSSEVIWQDNMEVVQRGWHIRNSGLFGGRVSDCKDKVMLYRPCKVE